MVKFEFRKHRIDLDEYEKKLGFLFPPIYKAFLSNFCFEPKKQEVYLKRTEQEKKFIDSDFRLISLLAYASSNISPVSYKDDELGFMKFKDIESLLNYSVLNVAGAEDMIIIADTNTSDLLLVGNGKQNLDKIYLYSTIREKLITFISNNVLDFISDCKIVECHHDRMYYEHIRKIESNELYKNWGEDFWRIREDEKTV
jgi:hypothetical protein